MRTSILAVGLISLAVAPLPEWASAQDVPQWNRTAESGGAQDTLALVLVAADAAPGSVQYRRAGRNRWRNVPGGMLYAFRGDNVRTVAGGAAEVLYLRGGEQDVVLENQHYVVRDPAEEGCDGALACTIAGAVSTLGKLFGQADSGTAPVLAHHISRGSAVDTTTFLFLPDSTVWTTASAAPSISWVAPADTDASSFTVRFLTATPGVPSCLSMGEPAVVAEAVGSDLDLSDRRDRLTRGALYRIELYRGERRLDAGCLRVAEEREAGEVEVEVQRLREGLVADTGSASRSSAHALTAALLAERGFLSDAVSLLRRALEANPNDAVARRALLGLLASHGPFTPNP